MTDKLREAAQQALEWFDRNTYGDEAVDVYEALCTALAEQPAGQEPVAEIEVSPFAAGGVTAKVWSINLPIGTHKVYTKPQPAKQMLTEGEIDRALDLAGVPELPAGHESVEIAIAQRDELLAMLNQAVRRLESAHARGETIMRHWIVDARALIAKVKGETS